jgi:response regulator RpfG family c-di-GMP phosphodiesterase
MTMQQAFDHLQQQAGVQFDPDVVTALLKRREEIEEVSQHYPSEVAGAA